MTQKRFFRKGTTIPPPSLPLTERTYPSMHSHRPLLCGFPTRCFTTASENRDAPGSLFQLYPRIIDFAKMNLGGPAHFIIEESDVLSSANRSMTTGWKLRAGDKDRVERHVIGTRRVERRRRSTRNSLRNNRKGISYCNPVWPTSLSRL